MKIRFRVWCEFEVDGKTFRQMESEAGWFLLSQTGQIMSHGPMGDFDPNAARKYTTLVPMLFTGLHDKNGTDIYVGDIVMVRNYLNGELWEGHVHPCEVETVPGGWELKDHWCHESLQSSELEVIGNIYENPEPLS